MIQNNEFVVERPEDLGRLQPCRKVGLSITWRCSCRCTHCFYLRNPKFRTAEDATLKELEAQLNQAAEGGLNHCVLVGWGEPTLHPDLFELFQLCRERNFKMSIITNGTVSLNLYKSLYDLGLDHLHISSHGVGQTMTNIMGSSVVVSRQKALKEWMHEIGWKYRVNATMQKLNYQELPALAQQEIDYGVWHFCMLGVLGLYEWAEHARDIVVHPAELRPYIEKTAQILKESNAYFNIRYMPFCHLDSSLWKFVTNARWVVFDPYEWLYSLDARDKMKVWQLGVSLGNTVACHEPCNSCLARPHCGGYQAVLAGTLGGAGLKAIAEIPAEYKDVWDKPGGIFLMNPLNQTSGNLRNDI